MDKFESWLQSIPHWCFNATAILAAVLILVGGWNPTPAQEVLHRIGYFMLGLGALVGCFQISTPERDRLTLLLVMVIAALIHVSFPLDI